MIKEADDFTNECKRLKEVAQHKAINKKDLMIIVSKYIELTLCLTKHEKDDSMKSEVDKVKKKSMVEFLGLANIIRQKGISGMKKKELTGLAKKVKELNI